MTRKSQSSFCELLVVSLELAFEAIASRIICQELLVCLLVAESVKALRGIKAYNAISLEQSLFSEIRESKSKKSS